MTLETKTPWTSLERHYHKCLELIEHERQRLLYKGLLALDGFKIMRDTKQQRWIAVPRGRVVDQRSHLFEPFMKLFDEL